MQINKVLKPELVCTKDQTRPMLAQPWLDMENERLLACDGFALAVVPVDVDETDFTGPVPVDALKMARKDRRGEDLTKTIECGPENVQVQNGAGKLVLDREAGRYPDVEQIIPHALKTGADVTVVALDAKRLYDLARAICDTRGTAKVKLYIGKNTHPLYVEPVTTEENAPFGVLMPVRID